MLLIGLTGLVASMMSFGFARSFPQAVLSRVIAGVLNGNIGVAKTMVRVSTSIQAAPSILH